MVLLKRKQKGGMGDNTSDDLADIYINSTITYLVVIIQYFISMADYIKERIYKCHDVYFLEDVLQDIWDRRNFTKIFAFSNNCLRSENWYLCVIFIPFFYDG